MPWSENGSGRARHGSSRSSIWTGGGVTHGPRTEKGYGKKINRVLRAKALATVLSRKFADGEMLFVDGFSFSEPKAKDAKQILNALGGISGKEGIKTKRTNAALIVLTVRD